MDFIEPGNFTTRPAALSDVPAIYGLLQSHERALYVYTDKILAYVQMPYSQPSLDFAGDTCLVFDRAGQLVGSMLLAQSGSDSFSVTICVFPPEPDSHLCDYLVVICIESVLRLILTTSQERRGSISVLGCKKRENISI